MGNFFEFITNCWLQLLSCIVISYLLGSINFSIIITKKNTDIRKLGSGNAGFTNMIRSVGKVPALITLFGDISKCALAILLSRLIFTTCYIPSIPIFYTLQYAAYISGIFCIIGHIYPCYFGFKGGKGVLTTAAMAIFIDPRAFLLSIGIFFIVLLISKIVSLSSICAAISYPIMTFLMTFFFDYIKSDQISSLYYLIITTVITSIIAIILIYKHKENIRRLINGTEKKISINKNF